MIMRCYRKSECHSNVDMLSRLPLPETVKESFENELYNIQVGILPVTVEDIKEETGKDGVLQRIVKYLKNDSWPQKVDPECKPYAAIKDELSLVEGNIIMWGLRVVIPKSLRKFLLDELHCTHPGISRMKALARIHLWYPKINADIEDLAKHCNDCMRTSNSPNTTPPHPWEWTTKPMQRIHLDFFGPFYEHQVLVMVDAYSGWIEAQVIKKIDSTSTIKILSKWLSQFGIPLQIVTDNGSQFTSAKFASFVKQSGITHITTPAYHQSSNGIAERAVQTVKRGLRKNNVKSEGFQETIDNYLMFYRATPNQSGFSPSELFLGRRVTTILDLIKPVERKSEPEVNGRNRKLKANDKVLMKNEHRGTNKWIKGQVIKVLGSRCYLVQVTGNRIIKRHIDQLILNKNANIGHEVPITEIYNELNERMDIVGEPQGSDVASSNHEDQVPQLEPYNGQDERRYPERIRLAPVGIDE